MTNRKFIYGLLLLLLLLAIVLGGIIFYLRGAHVLKVAFLDVGQGDAILISKGSNQILVDGGPSGKRTLEKLGERMPFWDRTVEAMVATHPDKDHIGGLIDVAENYQIGAVIETSAQSESQTYKTWEEKITERNISKVEGRKGVRIKIGEDTILEIINPLDKVDASLKDTNSASIISLLQFGENRFLLTGDATADSEREMLARGENVKAQVLKIAHHGSKYSTTAEFLAAAEPKAAAISAGANNVYGHPSEEVIARLQDKNVKILRTDEQGDIVFLCREASVRCVLEN